MRTKEQQERWSELDSMDHRTVEESEELEVLNSIPEHKESEEQTEPEKVNGSVETTESQNVNEDTPEDTLASEAQGGGTNDESFNSSDEQYKNLYDVYSNLDTEDKTSIKSDTHEEKKTEESNNKDEQANDSSKRKAKKGKVKLSTQIDARTGVMLLDGVLSTVSPAIYNMIYKDHKTSKVDWKMTNDDKNMLLNPMALFLDYVEISPPNPIITLIGAVTMVSISRGRELRSAHKHGTKVEKKGDNQDFAKSSKPKTGKGYVKKWIDRSNKIVNPDHPEANELVSSGKAFLPKN